MIVLDSIVFIYLCVPPISGGFLQFVCVPMFDVLARHFSFLVPIASLCKSNLKTWTRVGESEEQLPRPTANELVAMGFVQQITIT